ncbi:MAG: Sec-independent protein translocase protein TatB [Helicobacteraceae bacterium]|jgi:sec-independent protein translocase protein TatB|nr:Sec-independent protein translocase protein TatB [Helicobacteraceae bacterium]
MFGIGFGEFLLVAVVAIVFLGPEKLPDAMVKCARFFRQVKKSLSEAKTAFDQEINLSELKRDALEYKESVEKMTRETAQIEEVTEINREVRDLFGDLKKTGEAAKKEIDA